MSRKGKPNRTQLKRNRKEFETRISSCLHSCCFYIAFICTFWLLGTFIYNYYAATTEDALPETPGLKLRRLGLRAKHPVVFVSGIITGALDLWEGKPCANRFFRERFWGESFANLLQE
ncbi:hypothetical protein ISN45_Aa02g008730 [Arabidopsis thaliana x Arabidopsis arenosa]|uniref:Transmembrane protein n=1 Tax=Arabidopsis thaliana x Arabidopsis arenosa TaxID=1240361 RepID=A0A8T2BF92_9BRAS|nr:hypothetical protein ISN45_Aa02g008730 [Arabidopsis thaliana x Arabidopsis arenosa]